jgi:hypothetical protein
MNNKRFFAYGCSFTSYAWPTWADILGRQYDQYYNYGQPGAGNMYIFNSIIESENRHKFTKDDIIIIQWTCSSREDRYKNGKWVTPGGVANYYTSEELKKFFDFRGFVIRDVAIISAMKGFLDNIGCEYHFISMVSFVTNNMYNDIFETDTEDIAELYKDLLSFIKPSFHDVLKSNVNNLPRTLQNIKAVDSHPLPTEHYKYIKTILPHLLTEPESIAIEFNNTLSKIWLSSYQWDHVWPDVIKGVTNIEKKL